VIKCIERISKRRYSLDIVGGGPLYDELYQFIYEAGMSGRIRLHGYISDSCLFERYLACDAVVVPASHSEGFGLPVIEAYSFGKKAFVSDVDALPEIICNPAYILPLDEARAAEVIERSIEYKDGEREHYYKYFERNFSLEIYREAIRGIRSFH
jgi:glycosyltransferase involved in cell wall biosynthesis